MDLKDYEYLPTSPVIDDVISFLVAAPNIGLLTGFQKVSAGRRVSISNGEGDDQSRIVTFENASSTVWITISKLSDIQKGTSPARSILILLLILMAKQCLQNGTLRNTKVRFSLKDLVSYGLYSSTHTARVGFERAMDILQSIRVAWSTKKKKQMHSAVLFTTYHIENSKCTVPVNSELDWSFIVRFYTVLPSCFPRLPLKAAILLYTVMYLLRQNVHAVIANQAFFIQLSTVMIRLALPDPADTKNPKRDILEPIIKPMEQINGAIKDEDLRLEIIAPEGSKTSQILDMGKMVVHVGGTPLAYCNTIPKKARSKREAIP